MDDAKIAEVARRLANALQDFAYTRKEEDKKRVAEIDYELIKVVKEEEADAKD